MRSIIKSRKCRLKECSITFSPKNNKGAYCSDKHRLIDNKNRRNERDLLFNEMMTAFKKNYQILLLYDDGVILTSKELLHLKFDFICIPQPDDDGIHWFGHIGLFITENYNYKIKTKKT
jgi:hypothetical protein